MRIALGLIVALAWSFAALACSNPSPYCEPGAFMPTYGSSTHCVVLKDTMDQPAGDGGADGDSGG